MMEGGTANRVIDTPINELWNEQHFLSVREAFDKGEKHPACKRCWVEEDAGRDSKRIRDNRNYTSWSKDKGIKILDLSTGNTCNLQCRTCNPASSSKWAREAYDLEVSNKEERPWKVFLQQTKLNNDSWDEDSLVWGELDKLAENIVHIDFFGGEPWLLKKQWAFVAKAVSEGWSKNMFLHYNTNGTQWHPELISLFKEFKRVHIGFSIDGIGEQFEYMRYLAEWPVVLDNLNKAKEFANANPNVVFDICHTISSLNIFYVPEFINYFKDDWHIYLNLVHSPNYYSITALPDHIKKTVIDKLETIEYEGLPEIISLINKSEHSPEVWKEFKRRISIHDKYREQDYYTTFSEFGKIIDV